jgi:hypothetical protein
VPVPFGAYLRCCCSIESLGLVYASSYETLVANSVSLYAVLSPTRSLCTAVSPSHFGSRACSTASRGHGRPAQQRCSHRRAVCCKFRPHLAVSQESLFGQGEQFAQSLSDGALQIAFCYASISELSSCGQKPLPPPCHTASARTTAATCQCAAPLCSRSAGGLVGALGSHRCSSRHHTTTAALGSSCPLGRQPCSRRQGRQSECAASIRRQA